MMRHLKYLAFVACLGSLSPAFAQNASKSLTVDDLITWQRITDREISDNGKWVACKMEPWEGDATVYLYAAQGQESATFPRPVSSPSPPLPIIWSSHKHPQSLR